MLEMTRVLYESPQELQPRAISSLGFLVHKKAVPLQVAHLPGKKQERVCTGSKEVP